MKRLIMILTLLLPIFRAMPLETTHHVEFSIDQVGFDRVAGYDLVSMSGEGGYLELVGYPMLPYSEVCLALPKSQKVVNVTLGDRQEKKIPGVFQIFPSQPPGIARTVPTNTDLVLPDKELYRSCDPYPDEQLLGFRQADLGGQSILIVRFCPIRFVPCTGGLALTERATLHIRCEEGYTYGDFLPSGSAQEVETYYLETLRGLVINPEQIELRRRVTSSGRSSLPSGSFQQVVVTPEFLASGFDSLVFWHNRRGTRDTVITTDWIDSSYSSMTLRLRLREFVADAHSNWGTLFFLFGGEPDIVPCGYRLFVVDYTPSDQFFSDYDDDWLHEVIVGRASVETVAEAAVFSQKVILYETSPPLDGYTCSALLVGMDLDSYTPCEVLKDSIRHLLPDWGHIMTVYDSDDANHRSDFIEGLNYGYNLVNHADHADWDCLGAGVMEHWWWVDIADVNPLSNDGRYSVVVSLGCDANNWEQEDCISEYLVLHNVNTGAVAFAGNTRPSSYTVGDPLGPRGTALDLQWWTSAFVRGFQEVGALVTDAKHHSPHSNDEEKHSVWTFNLLGEPSMPLWTDSPGSLAVACTNEVNLDVTTLVVQVDDITTGTPAESAYVCVWKPGDVFEADYTDENGEASFDFELSLGGILNLTATKPNRLPFLSGVTVQGYHCGDADGSGSVDIDDAVHLISYIFSGGDPPEPFEAGDADCSDGVDIDDAVYLIAYIFSGGPAPCDLDDDSVPNC